MDAGMGAGKKRNGKAMKILTKRQVIKQVAARWHDQYHPFKEWMPLYSYRMGVRADHVRRRTQKEIYDALMTLDLELATEAQVADITGNDSWTSLQCENCDEQKDALYQFKVHADRESAMICKDCIAAALAEFSK